MSWNTPPAVPESHSRPAATSSTFSFGRPASAAQASTQGPRIPGLNPALAATLSSGSFCDTVYYLFSRRRPDGGADTPKTVYANSTILKASAEHFRAQLSGGFSVSDDVASETSDYGFESDSDLDETEEVVGEADKPDSKAELSKSSLANRTASSSQFQFGVVPPAQAVQYRVVIPDVAAATWQALVFFVYTGEIHFAPLRSQGPGTRRLALFGHKDRFPGYPPPCSPKSMYRLADIVGMPQLKAKAKDEIKSQLFVTSITKEIFSPFSSNYPEVLAMQLEYLYKGGHIAKVLAEINENIDNAMLGQIPHGAPVLRALMAKLTELLCPPRPPTVPASDTTPGSLFS